MMKNITKIQDEKFSSVMWNDEKNGQLGEKECDGKKVNERNVMERKVMG